MSAYSCVVLIVSMSGILIHSVRWYETALLHNQRNSAKGFGHILKAIVFQCNLNRRYLFLFLFLETAEYSVDVTHYN